MYTDVGEEFSGCGCSQVQAGTVQVRVLFSQDFCVFDLENLIKTELEETLKGDNKSG